MRKMILGSVALLTLTVLAVITRQLLSGQKSRHILEQKIGLILPKPVSEVKVDSISNEESKRPSIFISRFRCDSLSYFLITNNLISADGQFDSSKFLITESYFKEDFWSFQTFRNIDKNWWHVQRPYQRRFLFANYFNDKTKEIGNKQSFDGRIVMYYFQGYAYLMIESWPDEPS